MNLLVTGGAGFIGSNFVRYWLEKHPNDNLVVLDKLTYAGHLENLAGLDSNKFVFVKADICDFEESRRIMKDCDIQTIVHFAAESHVDRSLSGVEGSRTFYRTNIEGTTSLLHAAREAGVSHFHHISTDEVYGALPEEPKSLRFHENYPYNPTSPYSISKAASDQAVRGFGIAYKFPFTITNCTNNYGPYQTPEKMIPRSLLLLQQGQKLKLYTDEHGRPGPNIRDWLHVIDHCSAIEAVLQKGRIGETYCVGGDAELSNYQLVEKMLKIMSKELGHDLNFENSVELVADRPGHDLRYAMDCSKIKKELGWRPKYTFETGFRETVNWYNSPEGRQWLETVQETAKEVRKGQDKQQRE